MSEFFSSLGADLRDRRFLPILAALGVALIAAVAYAVLGGGSSTGSTPAPRASTHITGVGATVTITKAPETSSKQALAETTGGAPHQTGSPRDPFKPLPGAKSASSSSQSSSSSSTSNGSSASGKGSSSSSSGESPSGAGGANPSTPSKPSAPSKPRYYIHYHVTAEFGVVPAPVEGAPAQPAQLKTYKDMPLNEPLPSKEDPQLVFLGVVLKTGKSAAFALTGEAILHGSAVCKPSATQCQAIELQAGQSETLEVFNAAGQPVTYELKLVSIAKSVSSARAARAHAAVAAVAKVDGNRALVRSKLRFSSTQGGLVFVWRQQPATAHAARQR
jgi:hypothetical protein